MLFSVLAAMTLCYGNLGALLQTNVKRLFGYSSIGHAGYILIGLAVGRLEGVTAALYYLIAYALANLAGFFVISLVGENSGGYSLDAFKGLSRRSPFLAGVFFISLLSLAGVPPLAGFFGKFLILLAAVRGSLGWLALLGLLFVAVSLYYYLTIVRAMYIEAPVRTDAIPLPFSVKLLLMVLVLGIVLAGIWQAPFLHFAQIAAASLG
jgi:NADH-quinone oxidoreductase subunit N